MSRRQRWAVAGMAALVVALGAGGTLGTIAYARAIGEQIEPVSPMPVNERVLYGRWDGVVTVDGQLYCLQDWPCYDYAVNPGFEG